MNKHSSIGARGSLLERAADIYDFGAALRGRAGPPLDVPATPEAPLPVSEPEAPAWREWTGPLQPLDRMDLVEKGFVLPDGRASGISEEFRIVKRQLLLGARERKGADGLPGGNRILICSAHSGEGKTFCAVNLALSMAAEKDIEVLLIDADVGKPSVPETLGLAGGPGLMDALADPLVAVEDCVIRTDFPTLAVLPAGRQTNNDTEYLASERTERLLASLAAKPNRVLLFDSPPLLAASAASVLAAHVGQALLVVRADRTTESTLRDAAAMLKGSAHVQLLLNGVNFAAGGRRFGTYYSKAD